jgi:hypothetical protein
MRPVALALAASALLVAAPAAGAADYTVTGGKLDWTIANHYASGDPARTWLGYATNTQGPGAANGSVAASAPATITGPGGAGLTTVDTASPRGVDQFYTLGFAAGSGEYTDAGVGSVELTGTFTFTVHGLPITLVDPQITLDGLTGTLKSSGTAASMSGQAAAYDRSKTQFTLDLSNATVVLRANGARTITGIVPVSTADTVLAGFGPNSRRYGTMSLTLALSARTPQVLVGATGRDGAAGPAGPAGKDGRDAELRVIRLKRAPFATKREVHVRLIDRKTRKTVARGTVERRTLRLGVLTGTKLKGSYLLRRTATKASGKREARITIR